MSGLLSAMAADPGKLYGRVIDNATQEPVVGVIVKYNGGYTTTDRSGHFVLSPRSMADSVVFRCLGYEVLTLPTAYNFSEVRLIQKDTQLNDVVVEAPDIYTRGDTLVFNVAQYANAKDNAIIDVIKRLPGIKVEDDGTIKYQGKPINKFYLDGNDFIGGQYGLATNNISHSDVKSVEVMENHQPVKALEGIEFPEEAGINLKLKEDARSRWVGVTQASAGLQPTLFDGSLFTMRMAPRIQNMFTLKADNTGWNPVNEIKEHDFDTMFSSDNTSALWPEYISADMIFSPLSEKRTRDNLSWLANVITSWKAGDNSMRVKLDYMGDRLDYKSGVITDYLSKDIPIYTQNNAMRTQSHDFSAQFYSEINKRSYYLKDKFTLSGSLDNLNSIVSGSSSLVQRVQRKTISANNDLRLIKRSETNLFTLTSRNTFAYRPDRLHVSGDEDAEQTIGTTDFRSTTETRFGKLTRFWKYYLTAALDVNYHRMNSLLEGLGIFDNNGVHESFLTTLNATPQVDYDRNGWRLSIVMPIKWLHHSVSGQHDYINVSSRFDVRKQLTSKSELSCKVSYRVSSPSPYLYFDMPILSDYRNLFIAQRTNRYSHELMASMSYRYRNPIRSLFFYLSAEYSFRHNAITSNQLFVEDMIISTYADRVSDNNTWSFKSGFSKGFGHSKMIVGYDATASLATASSMRDNVDISYRQVYTEIKPYIKGSILRWLSATYEAKYSFSKLIIKGDRNTYHTFHHNLFATIIPNDFVQFTIGSEYFINRFAKSNTANLILLDASAVWHVNNKIRLSVTGKNLLNKCCYKYIDYGVLSRSEHIFYIRQRAILASIQYRF